MPATVTLVRHGETAWSLTGQHTGLTDIPLTAEGERKARALQDRFRGITFTECSPARSYAPDAPASWPDLANRRRSIRTSLNGTTATTRGGLRGDPRRRPGRRLFRDGCPNGETSRRGHARRSRRRPSSGDGRPCDRIFKRPHLKVLAARWPGIRLQRGACSAQHRERERPRLRAW